MATTLPKNYDVFKDKGKYMNAKQLEYFRLKLLDWKQELLEESSETLEHLKEKDWNVPDEADQASLLEENTFELRTRDRYRKLINKIERALERIENGEYGFCEETGKEIGLKRLEARPIATLCIEEQEKHEQEEKQSA